MLKKFLIMFVVFAIGFSTSYAEDKDVQKQEETKNQEEAIKTPEVNSNKPETNAKKPEKSLMFSEANISDIFMALLKYNSSSGIDPSSNDSSFLNSQNGGANNTFFDENNVSIYLNSILYISKTHWSIWINENKITNLNNGDGEISVITISPLYATFAWKMGISRWNIINANGMIPESKYKINDDEVVLYFGLSPNQTYIPATNKIIEGKIKREVPKDNNDNNNLNNQNNQNQQNNISNQDNLFF